MLASITPLGERGRSNRWGITVAAHLVGSVASAGLQGALLGAVGGRIGPLVGLGGANRASAMAGVVAVAVGLDVVGVKRPGLHRQVAESWLDTYRGWAYGGGFGLQLGLAWATIVTTWLVWAVLVGAVLTGSAPGGAAVGVAFGLGRGVPILVTGRVRDGSDLAVVHRRLARLESPFRFASLAGAVATALVLVAAAGA